MKTTVLTALAPATWGTTYFVTTEFLPPDRPLLTATLRALPAGLLALAVARTLPQGSWWWRSGVLGALNIGVFFGLLFVAAYRLPGGLAAILVASAPLFVVALAWPLLGERPTIVSVSAGTVGLAGVALLVLSAETTLDPVGAAGALGAAVSLALGIVLTKRWGRPAGLVSFTAWQLVAGGLLLLPVALAAEGAPPDFGAEAVGGFVYLGLVGTALAYMLWFHGIGRLAATRRVTARPAEPARGRSRRCRARLRALRRGPSGRHRARAVRGPARPAAATRALARARATAGP